MSFKLRRHPRFPGRPGPLVVVVLDGVGSGARDESDAVHLARTPTLDRLISRGPTCTLRAHGTAVGMPSDADMGNSEVGHNALGAGRVYDQGAKLVSRSIRERTLFSGATWNQVIAQVLDRSSALHFIGLLSDGNVHSHIDHLFALLREASRRGVSRLFVHVLTDGRDVPDGSALLYVDRLEAELRETGGKIASGGGRMLVTMDRYGADWNIVRRGFEAHVHGNARRFPSARAAIETFREETPGISDQFLPPFVIEENGQPVGPVHDGDAVIFFNFRGDRAIEISQAFEQGPDWGKFDRGRKPDVLYAGMMEYDGDFKIPRRFLVPPPAIERTMGEYLAENGVTQLAISETQKYGHVTYFWNGNRGGMINPALETYVEIPSDLVPFEERPWMKAAEITDKLIAELRTGRHKFARVNFANGDMVGHTGNRDAAIIAVECVDLALARLSREVTRLGGILIVTADHGNADEMYEHDKDGKVLRDKKSGQPVPKTSHTLNPVPFVISDPLGSHAEYRLDEAVLPQAGLAHVAATCLNLLGFERPEDEESSLLTFP
ncbi:MAG: 2,3-bisphosphoglycerate-independent phosphoglycerate mutase [Deltaproteobacteria bacterium]|nr:2,3-bisphosphoglycerate-independent phosphoglycerate mutase [Deltaproteobacteria bacterium]